MHIDYLLILLFTSCFPISFWSQGQVLRLRVQGRSQEEKTRAAEKSQSSFSFFRKGCVFKGQVLWGKEGVSKGQKPTQRWRSGRSHPWVLLLVMERGDSEQEVGGSSFGIGKVKGTGSGLPLGVSWKTLEKVQSFPPAPKGEESIYL